MNTTRTVYFDNAATTQLRDEVVDAMSEILKSNYGNPSSLHSYGRASKAVIERCRKDIAAHFNVSAGEIIFTSGGTEADNLALRSAARDLKITHFISSKIEHHAVLRTLNQLQTEYNVAVSYVNILDDGNIDLTHLDYLLQQHPKTLVSLMHVNNEVGNLLDLDAVADLCTTYKALFHCDMVQSVGHYEFDLSKLKVDFMAVSAHKFHGPKGIGFAFVRKNSGLKPLIFGGLQERGFRAGTESIHNIVGLELALRLAYANLREDKAYIKRLKKYFIETVSREIPDIVFNGCSGDLEKSTYTLINIAIPVGSDKAGMLLFHLDLKGIACSKASACQSGGSIGSHVLSEILSQEDIEKPSIRFSFSIYNTLEEVDYVVKVLKTLTD
ncbi:MAG: cysteine desulfurase [Flavobacteriaceae bacterium]|nr:cysteine desulfurase [Flavobacteriaceae bacterium]